MNKLRTSADGGGVASSSGTPRRVLVVDDSHDAAESMALILQLRGHEVQIAHDGPSALTLARSFHPHAVLLDIGLPGMDGYEVAARLREQPETSGVFIAAVTGYGREEDKLKALAVGCNHHLTKPVVLEELETLLGGVAEHGA
jgi:CheY-like chemotaxis protein